MRCSTRRQDVSRFTGWSTTSPKRSAESWRRACIRILRSVCRSAAERTLALPAFSCVPPRILGGARVSRGTAAEDPANHYPDEKHRGDEDEVRGGHGWRGTSGARSEEAVLIRARRAAISSSMRACRLRNDHTYAISTSHTSA